MRHSIHLAALALVAVAASAFVTSPVRAQTPPTPPTPAPAPPGLPDPQTGDVVWAFAQEFPFSDGRVALALVWTMAPAVGSTPLPAAASLRRGIPPADVTLLMEAAGLRARPGSLNVPPSLNVVGACKIWIAPAPAGITPNAPLNKSAEGLGNAFVQAMRDLLGVTLDRCTTTTEIAQAQLLVWTQGGPVPANPMRQTPTLLAPVNALLPPGQRGGGLPAPANTGNGGLDAADAGFGLLLTGLMVTASAMIGARALGRRRG